MTAPRALALLAAIAVVGALAPAARAHVVERGIGSQSELRLSPRRIRVNYNLGYSALLGLGELSRMDADKDGVVSGPEQEAWLDGVGPRFIAGLRLVVDGRQLPLRLLERRGLGIVGRIERVGFDTWWELVAECELGPGPHELSFHEGNHEGQEAEQLLWLPLAQTADLSRFESSSPGGTPVLEREGARRHLGRDLSLSFEFTPEALERDRAQRLIEPWLDGLDRAARGLRRGLASATEDELDALALRDVQFGEGGRELGITGGQQVGSDRVVDADSGRTTAPLTPPVATGTARPPSDSEKMLDALREPFSLAILLVFFLWGASHALMPGHGKTMVAAYLLGTQGRVIDAVRLGAIVTFTHTFALYTAGLLLVWAIERWAGSEDVLQRRLVQHSTLLSGLGLVAYGVFLTRSRWQAYELKHGHTHAHDGHTHAHDGHTHAHDGHTHAHGPGTPSPMALHGGGEGGGLPSPQDAKAAGTPSPMALHGGGEGGGLPSPQDAAPIADHAHSHDHAHDHHHGAHTHSHHGLSDEEHARVHAAEAAQVTSFRDLLVLGVTGGLVPCPAGVTLVLFSMKFETDKTARCFAYLTSFSLGLGSVLVAMALVMVAVRHLLDDPTTPRAHSRARDLLPVWTAGLIPLLGLGVLWAAFDPDYAALKTVLGIGPAR